MNTLSCVLRNIRLHSPLVPPKWLSPNRAIRNATQAMRATAYAAVFSRLGMQIENQAHIREYVETAIAGVLDTTKLEKKHADLDERLQGTLSKTQALIEKNAREALDQDEFLAEHRKLADRCAVLMAEMDEVERKISEMRGREASIDEYLSTLEQVERLPIEFSRRIWNMTIDTVTVHEGKRLVFRWKDGTTSERISGQACA